MERKRARSLVSRALVVGLLIFGTLLAIGAGRNVAADSQDASLSLKTYIYEAVFGSHDVQDWERLPFLRLKSGNLKLTFVAPGNGEDAEAIDALRGEFQFQADALNIISKKTLMSVETTPSPNEDFVATSRLFIFAGDEDQLKNYQQFILDLRGQPVMFNDNYYPLGKIDSDATDGCAKVFLMGDQVLFGGVVYIRADKNSFSDRLKHINESSCLSDAILGAFGFRSYVYTLPNCDAARCARSPSPILMILDMQAIRALYSTGDTMGESPDQILKDWGISSP